LNILRRRSAGEEVKILQRLLVNQGYVLDIDGDFGQATETSVRDYQIKRNLDNDGIVGPETWAALNLPPAQSPSLDNSQLTSIPGTPPWLVIARSLIGTKEIQGAADSPVILNWATYISLKRPHLKGTIGWYNRDSIPWCGLFIAYCMTKAGIEPPRLALGALNWKNDWPNGYLLKEPCLGSILVKSREGGGHVTFYEGEDNNYYYGTGGNQSDMVNVSAIRKNSDVKGFMWPTGQPISKPGRVMTTFAQAKVNSER